MIALMALLLALAAPAPPLPEPHPSACMGGWCPVVTWVAYDIEVPAVNKATGEIVPGVHFLCHYPPRWRGKLNRAGHHTCKLLPGDPNP